jgi:hypothetical protein
MYKRLKEEKTSEPLGKYAFGDKSKPGRRGRLKRFSVPYEKDTPIEGKLLDAINYHFLGFGQLSKTYSNMIQGFINNDKYSDIFSVTKSPVIYRGMSVSHDWLQKLLNKKEFSPRSKIDCNFLFTPRLGKGASSWTTDKEVAIDTGYEMVTEELPYAIVLCAKKSDNVNSFISSVRGLYRLQVPNEYKDQFEVIGLGNIKVTRIEWEFQE